MVQPENQSLLNTSYLAITWPCTDLCTGYLSNMLLSDH